MGYEGKMADWWTIIHFITYLLPPDSGSRFPNYAANKSLLFDSGVFIASWCGDHRTWSWHASNMKGLQFWPSYCSSGSFDHGLDWDSAWQASSRHHHFYWLLWRLYPGFYRNVPAEAVFLVEVHEAHSIAASPVEGGHGLSTLALSAIGRFRGPSGIASPPPISPKSPRP